MTTKKIQDAIIKIFYYDFYSKVYTGTGNAELCQKTKKNYLIPYDAVIIPIPDYKHGEIPVYDEKSNNWILRKDIRGVWYNKHTREQIELRTINADITQYTRIKPLPFSKWDEKLQCWSVDTDAKQSEEKKEREKTLLEEAIYQIKNTAYLGLPHILKLYSEENQAKIKDYHVQLWHVIEDIKQGKTIEILPILDL
jgi:hypothetical protein